MSFVTDISGPGQNQTHILPNFSENIGGRGTFSTNILNKAGKKDMVNGNLISCINWLLNTIRIITIKRGIQWQWGDNSYISVQICYGKCRLFLQKSLDIGVIPFLYTADFFIKCLCL